MDRDLKWSLGLAAVALTILISGWVSNRDDEWAHAGQRVPQSAEFRTEDQRPQPEIVNLPERNHPVRRKP